MWISLRPGLSQPARDRPSCGITSKNVRRGRDTGESVSCMLTNTNPLNGKISKVAATNIGVALVVVSLKYVAYIVSGSVALFSDALESIVNVITAVAAY